ncbi:MAG: acyl-CoA dehydratase activase [Desulfobacteraceae bacterium]|jgi:predicted CoA-substrate-specific enzyme activase
MVKAGIDFGSKYIHWVMLDSQHKPVHMASMEHNGDVAGTCERVLDDMEKMCSGFPMTLGFTGNMVIPGVRVFDPVISAVEANRLLATGCRTILSIGCESFYLIRLDENLNYMEHVVNSDCASGTGSFMDQQAERLGFTPESLAEKTRAFTGAAPSIATRCAVFAKSDIIHAQAQGFSKEAIATGLCQGVTRSVLSNTLKGRDIEGSVLFVGGMSLNGKIVDEISLSLSRDVNVPKESVCFNAIGAALLGDTPFEKSRGLVQVIGKKRETRQSLAINLKGYPDFSADESVESNGVEITVYHRPSVKTCPVYMGIDVGSTSTKMIVTDTDGTILCGLYGRTQGDPVDAVSRLLSELKSVFKDTMLDVKGVATTGSGRELIRVLIGADMAVNEITAHARGSVFLDPDVDTIIEIGGQDSKFTLLKNGEVTSATMNYVCAAGTGSFIEEQAKRLDMTLGEISQLTEGKTAPYTSDRCTVYMERDLNIFMSEGWQRDQIMAAVLYSVRDNYLSKVVGKRAPGKKIWFQGATARNKALVAVFENELKQPVHVSRYCHLTGALGCAVTLMDQKHEVSTFTGMDFSCEASSEICTLCSNNCDLRIYTMGTRKTAWGLKCGRDYEDKRAGRMDAVSRLEKDYSAHFAVDDVKTPGGPTIGMPETLFMTEYIPLFKDFFQRLGVNVVVETSSAKKLDTGMKMLNADFCAPMALAHGLVESLSRRTVDYIFLPTLINEQGYVKQLETEELYRDKMTDSYFCYYSSYAATIIDNLPGYDFKDKLLSPRIKFNNRPDSAVAMELADYLKDILHLDKKIIEEAFVLSRREYLARKTRWAEKGSVLIEQDNEDNGRLKLLLLGRPYALFDKRVNLGIPARLESLGFDLLSQSMVNPDILKNDPNPLLESMHWYFGQQVLMALATVKENPDVYPVFLTCFRCSPDSYLMNYFKDEMELLGKPYLILQLDEHSSDVGYLTRIEAAVDTFYSDYKTRKNKQEIKETTPKASPVSFRPDSLQPGDTVLIPMTDIRINRLQKAVFEVAGYKAEVVPLDREMMNQGYRYASGGECLPNVAIAGSLIETLKRNTMDPATTILYLPNLCLSCNFNQYANLVKLAGFKAGLGQIRVMNTHGLAVVPGLSARANAIFLSVTVLSSILTKLRYRFQPYEIIPGTVVEAVAQSEEIMLRCIRNKKSLFNAAEEIRAVFEALPKGENRKPRIGILGDMYAKYNAVLNDDICDYAESLGGEILVPSYNELIVHAAYADIAENNADERLWKTMAGYEEKFEALFKGLIDDAFEPPLDQCHRLMEDFGLNSFITGETAVSVGRLLYYIRQGSVDVVIHVNPLFCCPGVISSSLFRKIQDEFAIPVIDLFYDGTNRPNKMIDPHMFYLTRRGIKG